jgi:ribosomal protein S18 acetylase RimI-like enzyme
MVGRTTVQPSNSNDISMNQRRPTADSLRLVRADLNNTEHAAAIVALLDHYAQPAMGQAKPLDEDVRARLLPGLRAHQGTHIVLAYHADQPIGVAISFLGFSTFKAQPLLNIHDFAIHEAARGQGVGRRLMEKVIALARELGCCKVTLEVRVDNHAARKLYEQCGFEPGQPPQEFWTKPL